MAGRLIPLEDKVSQWYRVFDAIRVDLTPAPMRAYLAAMTEVEGYEKLASYMALAGHVMANDREAARVAAMLVNGNVRPPEDTSEQAGALPGMGAVALRLG